MSEERWLPVVGFDLYEVSDQGRVRNVNSGHILKSANNSPYPFVTLRRNGRTYGRSVHRLVAAAFVGNIIRFEVNHKDFDKTNNVASNLEIMTHVENIEHAKAAGRMKGSTGTSKCHKVRCIETKQEFASIRDAGWLMYISPGTISMQIRGLVPTARGYTFERIS